MANVDVGFKWYLQIGREATWGTSVAATHRFGVLEAGFDHDPNAAPDMAMTGSVNQSDPVATVEMCSGSVTMYADYDLMALLYDGVMGTATFGSNGGSTSGSGTYTHTWNDSKSLFNSFTMELIEGDVPTGKCALITGAKIRSARFSWNSGEGDQNRGRVTFEFVAKRKQTNQNPTSLSARTSAPILFRHLSSVVNGTADADADVKIEDLSLTITNPLLGAAVGGSGAYIDEPIIDGQRVPVISWTQRHHSKTLEDAFIAQTALTSPLFTFTSGSKSLTFNFVNARVSAPCAPKLSAFGVVRQSVTLTGYGNGSYAMQFVLVNAKSTITTI